MRHRFQSHLFLGGNDMLFFRCFWLENRTNLSVLTVLLGGEIADWMGHPMDLQVGLLPDRILRRSVRCSLEDVQADIR